MAPCKVVARGSGGNQKTRVGGPDICRDVAGARTLVQKDGQVVTKVTAVDGQSHMFDD